MIVDETFGQFISLNVRDEDKIDQDDSLGVYVLRVCKRGIVYHVSV